MTLKILTLTGIEVFNLNVYAVYTLFLHNYTLYEKRYNMGKMSREKGARFERQVAAMFREYGYDEAHRTAQFCGKTGQAADVEGVPGIHIECKHCERMSLYDWIDQAVRDTKDDKKPVVIHKANNKPVLVTMPFDDWIELYSEWDAGNIPFKE